MRKYYINSKQVRVEEWKEEFANNIGADVILKTQQIPKTYKPPEIKEVISPERAKELRSKSRI